MTIQSYTTKSTKEGTIMLKLQRNRVFIQEVPYCQIGPFNIVGFKGERYRINSCIGLLLYGVP